MAILTLARRVSRWIAMTLCVVPICWAVPSEYQVKAVFLFNFTQFVEWPPEAFAAADAPFVIGILGKDPFGSQLDDVIRGESVGRHPLRVVRYRSAAEIRDCNLLFIERAELAGVRQILAQLDGRSILTVADADSAEPNGIMIQLVTRSNRIRLRINIAAAKSGNLKVSSKLLRPAEVVGGSEG